MTADDRVTAIYLRVSTTDQSSRSQVADLQRYEKSIEGGVTFFEDKESGKTMDRPGWKRLWAEVLDGRVSRIVVWRLDRLGRTSSGLTQLFDELSRLKVGLVSMREGVDLDTPAGRLMCDVLASVAMYETSVRSERQRAGIAAAKASGVVFGRPGGKGAALKVTTEHRVLIHRLKAEGSKITSIARVTGLCRSTIYDVLKGEA